jgi:[acyl-carrier-protein] S-malonyltransferase
VLAEETAFIFPGQGSQRVGMGLSLYQTEPLVKKTFDEADKILGRPISQICFEGPTHTLIETENTQLAIFITSVASLRLSQQKGLAPIAVAGHSLGEYSALVAAEVIPFSDGVRLVEQRSRLMAMVARKSPGMMAAILGLDASQLQEICQTVTTTEGQVAQIANYNCPGQLIVSGSVLAIQRLIDKAKSIGAKRAVPLKVSGAFHSDLMEPARAEFSRLVEDFHFSDPRVSLVANVTGDWVTTGEQIRQLLVDQITRPVLWEKCLQALYFRGIRNFIEVGNGNVLAGLLNRTFDDATCTNVSTLLH